MARKVEEAHPLSRFLPLEINGWRAEGKDEFYNPVLASSRDKPDSVRVLADTRHRLGVSSPDRIELVKIGWQEDILI